MTKPILEKRERKVKQDAVPVKKEARSSSALQKQTHEIAKLLQVWPTVPVKVVEQFIDDMFDVTMTRRCLQEAKESLGLNQPDYSEGTLKKRALVEYVVCDLARHHGLAGLTEDQFVNKANRALNQVFEETTHSRMVRTWVQGTLAILRPHALAPGQLLEAFQIARDKIKDMNLLERITGQQSIL